MATLTDGEEPPAATPLQSPDSPPPSTPGKASPAGELKSPPASELDRSLALPPASEAAGGETTPRKRRKDPRGLKARDYSFLHSMHGDDVDELDDLVAEYKGLGAVNDAADVDTQRAALARLPVDKLLPIAEGEIRRRLEAQEQVPDLEEEAERMVAEHEEVTESLQDKAALLRERQLYLQLIALQLDQHNIQLKQKMQTKTRKLRDATETFKMHVEGLELSWEDYLTGRKGERDETGKAREKRLEEFRKFQKVLEEATNRMKVETDKYVQLHEKQQETSKKHEKELVYLATRLGLEDEIPKKRAEVTGVSEVIEPSTTGSTSSSGTTSSSRSFSGSCTETYTTSGTGSSSTYTYCSTCSSYTISDHCSTCGRTFSDLVLSKGSSTSSSFDASLMRRYPENLSTVQREPSQASAVAEQPQHHLEHRRRKKPRPDMLKAVHSATVGRKHGDMQELFDVPLPKGEQKPRENRRMHANPTADLFSPAPSPHRKQHPERGFQFPYV